MLVLLFGALWFNLRGDLLYVLPCAILFLCFLSPFSIAITSLGVERANLSAFRMFVRFVLVWICRFPLLLDVWEELRFVIVALPGLFSYLFCCTCVSTQVRYRRAVTRPFVRLSVRQQLTCERNSSYSFWPIILKLHRCFGHGV